MVQQTLLQSPAFSLTRVLLPPDPSPLPKVRDYLHRLFLQSLRSVHLPGKANIMLKSTGCKCFQSSHTADSLPPEEVTPLGKLLPYIKVQSFMQNSAHSACAPSQLAANKPKSEDIKKKKKAPLRAHSLWMGTYSCLLKRAEASQICTQQHRSASFYNPQQTQYNTKTQHGCEMDLYSLSPCSSSCGNTHKL